jgi:hypothetical protein
MTDMGRFPFVQFRLLVVRISASFRAGAGCAKEHFGLWQAVNDTRKTFSQILILLEDKTNG